MSRRDLCLVALVGSFRDGSYTHALAGTLDELAPDDVSAMLLGSVGELPHNSADFERLAFPPEATEIGGQPSRMPTPW